MNTWKQLSETRRSSESPPAMEPAGLQVCWAAANDQLKRGAGSDTRGRIVFGSVDWPPQLTNANVTVEQTVSGSFRTPSRCPDSSILYLALCLQPPATADWLYCNRLALHLLPRIPWYSVRLLADASRLPAINSNRCELGLRRARPTSRDSEHPPASMLPGSFVFRNITEKKKKFHRCFNGRKCC